MAATRNTPDVEDVQTTLKSETFKPLFSLLKRHKLGTHEFSPEFKVHCHIPVCIGYGNGTMPPDELKALVADVIARGYDFTIYAAPRNRFERDPEDPFDEWKRDNAELLDVIQEKIVLESDWRKSEAWQIANARYEAFKKDNAEAVERVLADDLKKFMKRQAGKNSPEGASNLGETEIKQHILACVVDSISWMLPESTDARSSINTMNVLAYTHDQTLSMRHAFQNAAKIGYVHGSLLHIKPEFEQTMECANTERLSATSPVQYAKNLSSANDGGLSVAQQQTLHTIGSLCLEKGVDELYLAKVAAAMLTAFEEQGRALKDEMAPAIASTAAASSLSPAASYTRNYQRQGSPGGVARGGMFASTATSTRNTVASSSTSSAVAAATTTIPSQPSRSGNSSSSASDQDLADSRNRSNSRMSH